MVANPDVDAYVRASEKWSEEMTNLRSILLSCGLTEEIKWGKPCYAYEGSNIVILQEMKAFLVEELQARLDQDPALKTAFEALTPGRQREYNLYFSGAKQAKTRQSRVEKHTQRILDGRGLRDR